MAVTFLAGVANARIFKGNDLFATAKTLVDSSITIGVSAEDIRAGKGAKLYGKYFHTSTFDLKMTDAMFKLEYIAANVGGELEIGGNGFVETSIDGASLASTIGPKAQPMVADGKTYIYVKKPSETIWKTVEVTETSGTYSTVPAYSGTDEYCVQYLAYNDSARTLKVKANFTPDTLSVYLDADLFSGDDKNPSTGTKIGTVTIRVPRFLLSGSQEIAMNMTGAAQTPFEGSALAANAEGCEGEGIYAEIVEVITGAKWQDEVTNVYAEGQSELKAGDIIAEVYVTANSAVKKLKKNATAASDGYTVTLMKGETTSSFDTALSAGNYVIVYTSATTGAVPVESDVITIA